MKNVVSGPDPYGLQVRYQWSRDDRVVSSPAIAGGETTAVFIVAGQSNAGNHAESAYTPTNASKVDNLNLYDGGTYQAVDPLLGCGGTLGNLFSRLADKLIDGGLFDRVVLVPIAIGATSITRWTDGGDLNDRLLVASRRCTAVGLPITAYLWQQGESDHGMAQSTYADHLSGMISSVRDAGYDAPWFLAKSTLHEGVTDADVRAALAAAVTGTIYAGPDTDTLTGATNRVGGTHFTDVGADAAADLWKTALDAVF